MTTSSDNGRLRESAAAQVAAWAGLAGAYAAGQAMSAAAAQRMRGDRTRSQYERDLNRPRFAPPGAAFPVVWSALNVTTATSAWRAWRVGAGSPDSASPRAAAGWWAAAIIVRSGYVPLAFGRRWLWAATADSALLTAVMTMYAVRARRTDAAAAALALPEIAWTAFATVLSAAIARRSGR